MKINIKWNVCRICLREDLNQEQSIFDTDDDHIEIASKIVDITGIRIEREANLPNLICKKCSVHLNIAYKFRSICINSDQKLQNFLIKTNNVITEMIPEQQSPALTEPQQTEDEPIYEEYVYIGEPDDDGVLDTTTTMQINEQNQIIDNDHNSIIKTEENEIYAISCIEPVDDDIEYNVNESVHYQEISMESNIEEYVEFKGPKQRIRKKGASVHVCEICGNKFGQKYLLENHMKWHRNEKPFPCELCGKNFALNFQLSRHMRCHTGEKPYSCKYCGRKFSDRSTNIKHERLHTGEKPFKCETCGKTFTYSDVLKKHMTIHTGEKPYSCEPCGKRFSQAHHLKFHLSTILHQTTINGTVQPSAESS